MAPYAARNLISLYQLQWSEQRNVYNKNSELVSLLAFA